MSNQLTEQKVNDSDKSEVVLTDEIGFPIDQKETPPEIEKLEVKDPSKKQGIELIFGETILYNCSFYTSGYLDKYNPTYDLNKKYPLPIGLNLKDITIELNGRVHSTRGGAWGIVKSSEDGLKMLGMAPFCPIIKGVIQGNLHVSKYYSSNLYRADDFKKSDLVIHDNKVVVAITITKILESPLLDIAHLFLVGSLSNSLQTLLQTLNQGHLLIQRIKLTEIEEELFRKCKPSNVYIPRHLFNHQINGCEVVLGTGQALILASEFGSIVSPDHWETPVGLQEGEYYYLSHPTPEKNKAD